MAQQQGAEINARTSILPKEQKVGRKNRVFEPPERDRERSLLRRRSESEEEDNQRRDLYIQNKQASAALTHPKPSSWYIKCCREEMKKEAEKNLPSFWLPRAPNSLPPSAFPSSIKK